MDIRPARSDDVDAIQRVAKRAWDATYDEILGAETIDETLAEWYSETTLRGAMDTPGTAFLVADEGGEVTGFCHGVVEQERGDILRMYVDPDRWGEGIGTALHERVRNDLLDFNMKELQAIVLADNDIGNEFYRKLGFEKVGEGEVTMGDETYTENVYTKRLAESEER
ncbi:GNAT family N-acetyltransferase [Halegenticoccus tardaugens]|uniref:GNAT family N-acetyltransferase n=1 Tax=Halegenticoccus tardaugens TaxID=2071624 RepID=UPI00100C0FD1|nr:GNAT family N-acetyltransferase [Halegenticoccus tardaugens]